MSDKSEISRRSFVTRASLGAAAAGALAVAGPFAGRANAAEAAAPVNDLPEPVVAHLTDLHSGKVSLYVGERGLTVTDHALAQHLARAIST
jgi:hypothetical protein